MSNYNLRGMTELSCTSSEVAKICLTCTKNKCRGNFDCSRYKKEIERIKSEKKNGKQ